MPKTDSSAKNEPLQVKMVRIIETQRTARWGLVCAVVAFGLWLISRTIIQVLEQPPWLVVVLTLSTSVLGPTGILVFVIKSRAKAIEKQHRRVKSLELQIDPKRTSSTLEVKPLQQKEPIK